MTTAIAEADLVVEARVDAHEFVREVGFRTRLTVSRIHKGVPARPLFVTAAKTCAVGFEPGTRYLVYASRDGDGGFTTTYCSRTAPLAQASADLAVLAPGAAPREPAPDTAVWPGLAAWIAWIAASSVEIALDR